MPTFVHIDLCMVNFSIMLLYANIDTFVLIL